MPKSASLTTSWPFVVGDDQVGGLDVAMDEVQRVRVLQRAQDLVCPAQGAAHLQRAVALDDCQCVGAVGVLGDEPETVGVVAQVA